MRNKLNTKLWIAAFLLTYSLPALALDDQINGQDLHLGTESVNSVTVGRDVVLDGTQVEGNVSAGREIEARECRIRGAVHAGRDLALSNSHIEEQVDVGRNLSLNHASVQGNANVGGQADLSQATIKGTLTIASAYLALKSSTLGNIHVEQPYAGVISNDSNNNIVIGSGNIVGASGMMVSSRNGQSIVHVGGSGVSSINGFTIRGGEGQTTVITPDNSIYVNGNKVSGNGPITYADYQAQNPQAPWVEGPGWSANMSSTGATGSKSNAFQQVVELMEGSVVTGNIMFDSGHGKVLMHSGSKILGSVQGGITENI